MTLTLNTVYWWNERPVAYRGESGLGLYFSYLNGDYERFYLTLEDVERIKLAEPLPKAIKSVK
jgi:hypothetical protein